METLNGSVNNKMMVSECSPIDLLASGLQRSQRFDYLRCFMTSGTFNTSNGSSALITDLNNIIKKLIRPLINYTVCAECIRNLPKLHCLY